MPGRALCVALALQITLVAAGRTAAPNHDGDFEVGVQKAVSIQDPQEERDRAREAFRLLQKSSSRVSEGALDAHADQAGSVLHFLLEVYAFSGVHRSQVEATVKSLRQRSPAWAAAALRRPVREHAREVLLSLGVSAEALGELAARGEQKLMLFLEDFGLSLEALASETPPEEVEEAQSEAPGREEEWQAQDPLRLKLDGAVSGVLATRDGVVFANSGEEAFGDLRRSLLHLTSPVSDGEKAQPILDSVAPRALETWQFLVKWATKRNFYQRQVAEVVRILLKSPAWKSALLSGGSALLEDPEVPRYVRAALLEALPRSPLPRSPRKEGAINPDPGPPAAQTGDAVPTRTVRILLARSGQACLHKEVVALARSRMIQTMVPTQAGSWRGCGIDAIDWLGAAPYVSAIAAAQRGFRGFGQTVHAAPYVADPPRGRLGFLWDAPARAARLAGADWDLADAEDEANEGATGMRDWYSFELFLANKVVPGLAADRGVMTVAVVASDGLIKEALGKRRGVAWHSYRSSLCREALKEDDAEVLEIWYEVLEFGELVALASAPDGGPSCRVAATCECFK